MKITYIVQFDFSFERSMKIQDKYECTCGMSSEYLTLIKSISHFSGVSPAVSPKRARVTPEGTSSGQAEPGSSFQAAPPDTPPIVAAPQVNSCYATPSSLTSSLTSTSIQQILASLTLPLQYCILHIGYFLGRSLTSISDFSRL